MPIVIEGEIHSSKNSKRIFTKRSSGKPFIAKSAASKQDEHSFVWQMVGQAEEWRRMTAGKQFPLCLVFEFRRKTRARFDYINMAQGLCDAMVKANLIPDDSADFLIPVFVPYTVDKHNPGCTLYVTEISNAMWWTGQRLAFRKELYAIAGVIE